MGKITEYSKITKLKDNDIFLVDGPDGTRTIIKKNAAKELVGEIIETITSGGNPAKVIYKADNENIELVRAEDASELETQIKLNNEYRLYDGNQTLKIYASRTAARTDVPSTSRKIGQTIVYRLQIKVNDQVVEDRIVRETYRGININFWLRDYFWDEIEVPNIYWGDIGANSNIFLKNYVKGVLCNESINIGLYFSWTNTNRTFTVKATSHNNDETTIAFIGQKVNVEISSFSEPNNHTIIQLDKIAASDPDIYVILDTYRLANETLGGTFSTMPGTTSISQMDGGCVYYHYVGKAEIDALKTGLQSAQEVLTESVARNGVYRLYDTTANTLAAYATRTTARTAVPSADRKKGLIITYRLTNASEDRVVTERFDYNINFWLSDNYWKDLDSKELYWGSLIGNSSHIENYVKNVTVDKKDNIGLQFVWSNTNRTFSIYATRHNEDQTAIKFVGKKLNVAVADIQNPSIRYAVELEKYTTDDPKIIVYLDVNRLVIETISVNFRAYTNTTLDGAFSSCIHTQIVKPEEFKTVFDAANAQMLGAVKVGQIMINGNDTVQIPSDYTDFVTKPLEDAYTPMVRNELYPFVKRAEQKRVTVDNVTMYMCSASERHIFFSACPNSNYNTYDSYDQFADLFMAYADKNDLDTIIKIDLPAHMEGAAYLNSEYGRRHYIQELSDGSVLVEVENGTRSSYNNKKINLYRIANFFNREIVGNTITIAENECVKVCEFAPYARINEFHSIEEYSPGNLIMAPYGAGKSARIYISHDYGQTWELIFCGDTSNTETIPVKSRATGVASSAGEWPTPAKVIPANSVDWTKTGNGNIHVHGIAYDRWYNRIWAVTGDGGGVLNSVTGIWYTDDEGLNWHKVELGGANEPFYRYGTQFISVIPLDNAVLFGSDGQGDGFYRWSRSGKTHDVVVEPCYQYTGSNTSLTNIGQDWYATRDGFIIHSYSPDNDVDVGDYKNRGGLVATYNGYSFAKIYVDSFTDTSGDGQLAYNTHEIGWGCHITEGKDHTLITSARQGGYLLMYL